MNKTHRCYAIEPEIRGYLLEDSWPAMSLSLAGIARVKARQQVPWVAAAVARMQDEAREVQLQPARFADGKPGWRHDYFSPQTAGHLIFDPTTRAPALDTAGGPAVDSEVVQYAWILLQHEHMYRVLRGQALLWSLHSNATENKRAAWIVDGLRDAIRVFTRDPYQRTAVGMNTVYGQHLYDAAMLILLADIWAIIQSAPEAAAIAEAMNALFADRMAIMRTFLDHMGTHNMSGFAALAIESAVDAGLTDIPATIHGKPALLTLVEQGMHVADDGSIDGFWYEGTSFYHMYTLSCLAGLYDRALERGDAQLTDGSVAERLRAMCWFPVRTSLPNGELMLFGDFGAPGRVSLARWLPVFEWASGRLDPAFGAVIARICQQEPDLQRGSVMGLAWGAEVLHAPHPMASASDILTASGIAILRSTTSAAVQAVLRAGPISKNGHEHPDRLSLLLWANGEALSPDLGEPGYGLRHAKHQAYVRTTFSHSTIIANEQLHRASAPLKTAISPESAHAQASIAELAAGVAGSRQLWVIGDLIVCRDQWTSEADMRGGWIQHVHGEWQAATPDTNESSPFPVLPDVMGFNEITQRTCAWHAAGRHQGAWITPQGHTLTCAQFSDGPLEVLAGRTPGNPYPHSRSTVVVRVAGTERMLISVFHVGGVSCQQATWDNDGITITLENGTATFFPFISV